MSEYFVVYYVYHKDELVYIGEGKPSRPSHATSGVSSIYELNKLHFSDAENVRVVIKHRFDTKKEAVEKERQLIQQYTPRLNKKGTHRNETPESMSKQYCLNRCIKACFGVNIRRSSFAKDMAATILFCKSYTPDEMFSGILVTNGYPESIYKPPSVVGEDGLAKHNLLLRTMRAFKSGKSTMAFEVFQDGSDTFVRLKPEIKQMYLESHTTQNVALVRNHKHCHTSVRKQIS